MEISSDLKSKSWSNISALCALLFPSLCVKMHFILQNIIPCDYFSTHSSYFHAGFWNSDSENEAESLKMRMGAGQTYSTIVDEALESVKKSFKKPLFMGKNLFSA